MTNKKFLLGILLLVFGITTAWADARLNGIWVNHHGTVRRMINGNFGDHSTGAVHTGAIGTYTVSGGRIILTITHVHGEFLRRFPAGRDAELRLYPVADARRIVGTPTLWQPWTFDFSISGNILTLTNAQGEVSSWLRKY